MASSHFKAWDFYNKTMQYILQNEIQSHHFFHFISIIDLKTKAKDKILLSMSM